MPPKLKASGQVVQENLEPIASEINPSGSDSGSVLKMDYVVGKQPVIKKLNVTTMQEQ